jgi:hypothetical protein
MYHHQNSTSCPPPHTHTQLIYVFRMILAINGDCFPKQHKPVRLCNGVTVIFLWGAYWNFEMFFRWTPSMKRDFLKGFSSWNLCTFHRPIAIQTLQQGLSATVQLLRIREIPGSYTIRDTYYPHWEFWRVSPVSEGKFRDSISNLARI